MNKKEWQIILNCFGHSAMNCDNEYVLWHVVPTVIRMLHSLIVKIQIR